MGEGKAKLGRAVITWTPERVAELRRLKRAKKPTLIIAGMLGVSRSATKAAVAKYVRGYVPIDHRAERADKGTPSTRRIIAPVAAVDDSASVRADRTAATLGCEALHQATLALFKRRAAKDGCSMVIAGAALQAGVDQATAARVLAGVGA